jgi:hypothetical protein
LISGSTSREIRGDCSLGFRAGSELERMLSKDIGFALDVLADAGFGGDGAARSDL